MNSLCKAGMPLAFVLGAGSALAVGYGTTATIDGTPYVVGGSGSPIQRLGDSISFSLPNAIAVGTTPKTITLTYTVTADPGTRLVRNEQIATGQNTGAATSLFTTLYTATPTVETSTQANGAGNAFQMYAYNFASPMLAYNVTTTLQLNPAGGVSKASAFTSHFTQSPVPEPISIAALALGLAGLVRRKRS